MLLTTFVAPLLALATLNSASVINRDPNTFAVRAGAADPDTEVITLVTERSLNPSDILKRQTDATHCKTIHNWFKWNLSSQEKQKLPEEIISKFVSKVFTLAWVRMDKTFCYDENVKAVSDATGDLAPPDALYYGNVLAEASAAGFSFSGPIAGTILNQFQNWNNLGRGSHVSSAYVKLELKCPINPCPAAQALPFQRQLYIEVQADGDWNCRGGSICVPYTNGNLPPDGWDQVLTSDASSTDEIELDA